MKEQNTDDSKKDQALVPSPVKDRDGEESAGGKSLTLSQAQRRNTSRFRTEEDIQGASLHEILKDQPAMKPFKFAMERCLDLQQMGELPEEAITIEELQAFHTFQDKWEDAVACGSEVMTSVMQTANDVVGHIKGEERKKVRKQKAEELQKEKDELNKIREAAAQAAQAIKSKAGKKQGPAIFAVNFKESGVITPVPQLTQEPEGDSEGWDRPFILENNDDLKLFFGNPGLRKTMTMYAASHTRTLQKIKGSTLGRDQVKIEDEDVLETCGDMMNPLLPELDVAEVEGGDQFMKGVYLFGYDSYPNMQYIGMTPSQAAIVKFLFIGQVKTLLIKMSSLVKVTSEKVGPACGNLDFFDEVGSGNLEKIKELASDGLCMYECIHSSNQMLFIPQGWLACEATLPGAPSHYGIRKAFFMKSDALIVEYETTIALFKASAKDVGRATAIMDKMKFDGK